MAQVAETAAMRPGPVYRRFENQHAIVLAIIEQQLPEVIADIRDFYHAPDFNQAIFDDLIAWRDCSPPTMNTALFLEITADSTRDPRISEALLNLGANP
jgi:AcrR family transcriptional regulator